MSEQLRLVVVFVLPTGGRQYVGPFRSMHAAERYASQEQYARVNADGVGLKGEWYIEPLERPNA